jgi:acyl dehydratase
MKEGVRLGKYLEEFKVGEQFISPSRLVTDAEIVMFAGLGGDYYPIHMEDEYAQACGFKGRIMHGLGTLCLLGGFMYQALPVQGRIIAHLKGEYTLPAPVYPGDTIYAEIEVVDKRESKTKSDRGIITFKNTVKNQNQEIVALVTISFMYRRRP